MAVWRGSTLPADPATYAQPGFLAPVAALTQPFVASGFASGGTLVSIGPPAVVPSTWPAEAVYQASGAFEFFEHFHVIPRLIALGNILSDQSIAIEVFSAYRRTFQEWTAFVNNGGAGIELTGGPVLPTSVAPLTGYTMTLDVSATGDPFVDSTIEFTFGSTSIEIPITVQRIVLWGAVPEQEFEESLSFVTDLLPVVGGKEQRISIRKEPRRAWNYRYLIDGGEQRQVLENLLFEWQSRVFGVPIWWEGTVLTASAAAAALSLTVESTDNRDFRVGGLVVVLVGQSEFDVVEISAITSTTIALVSGLIGSYAAGVEVFPLAVCRMPAFVQSALFRRNLSIIGLTFRSTENDVDLADASGFGAFGGKPIIVENVARDPTVSETFGRALTAVDSVSGLDDVTTYWDVHKRGTMLTIRAVGLAAVWQLRGLIYSLRGRQASFWLARSSDDLVPVADLLGASDTIDVANYGYTQFVKTRLPKTSIRISFVDESTPLLRTILSSSIVSAAVEQLTVDSNWPTLITPAEISRIEFVEKVRLDTDDVTIEYADGGNRAYMSAPVKVVFE